MATLINHSILGLLPLAYLLPLKIGDNLQRLLRQSLSCEIIAMEVDDMLKKKKQTKIKWAMISIYSLIFFSHS